MNRNKRQLFILFLFTGFTLSAFAFNPKLKPGLNDKNVTGNGNGEGTTEVKLPVGNPFQLTDLNPSSGGMENGGVSTDQPANIVYTFDLPDGVGPESVHETHSAFQQARSLNAACVLIHMNSFSNALDAAENLNVEMMDYDRPVMVYVNNRAIPASMLISIAADNKSNQNNNKSDGKFHSSKNNKRVNQNKNSSSESTLNNQNSSYGSFDNNCLTNPFNRNNILYSQTSNLNDVLVQAGMEKFTRVHYSAGFFSQVIDMCMKPIASLLLILLLAFAMRIQTKTAFPGPATFLLMVSLPLFSVPLFIGGLANLVELITVFLFCVLLIVASKRKATSFSLKFILGLLFVFALTLSQTGKLIENDDWKNAGITFVISSIVFLIGWLTPILFSKSNTQSKSVRALSASTSV